MPFENGRDQRRIVAGIIFQVGILDEHQFSRALRQAGANSGALAHVLVVQQQLHRIRSALTESLLQIGFAQELTRAIGGEVVDDDDLFAQADGLARDLPQQLHEGTALVVHRNDDGQRVKLRQDVVVLVEFGRSRFGVHGRSARGLASEIKYTPKVISCGSIGCR
jgi:hypothetical protein